MVSISIMAHEARREFIPYIQDKLGYECPVAWERGLGRRDTGRRAWELHDPAASHHLVLQDDVILSRNLPATLEKLVAVIKDQPISLFTNNKKPYDDLVEQCRDWCFQVRWLLLKRLNWGPAVLLPTRHIANLLAWTERNVFMPNYDAAIGYYYMLRGLPVWYTAPSLVDHRTDGDSLVWSVKSQQGRSAKWFIGEDMDGSQLDWQGGEVVCEPTSMRKYLQQHMAINEAWRLRQLNAQESMRIIQEQP